MCLSPSRAAAALAVAVVEVALTVAAGAGPALAQPALPPPPVTSPVMGAVTSPGTSGCRYQAMPPPPLGLSEVPAPGTAAPKPLPRPDQPLGGARMGECGTVLPPGAPPLPDGITATSWLVADLDSGEVLAAENPHARHRPASTIKLLTALVAADRLPPDRIVTGTQADADAEGSRAGIGPAGRYTVTQLLAGLLLSSGNDSAQALARELGGVPATLAAMNAKARVLGALDTRAASVSGLDAPGMSSSAYDLALVLREVLERPRLAELLHTPEVRFPGFGDRPDFVLANDNRLLTRYPGALGGKTGFTNDARHTYLGAAERDGQRLVAVLMRAEQRPVRTSEQAARLLDYGFALPAYRPVGRLVDGPPASPALSETTAPSQTTGPPAPMINPTGAAPITRPPAAAPGTAISASAPERDSDGAAVLGWQLAGIGVIAALVALLHRQHRHGRQGRHKPSD